MCDHYFELSEKVDPKGEYVDPCYLCGISYAAALYNEHNKLRNNLSLKGIPSKEKFVHYHVRGPNGKCCSSIDFLNNHDGTNFGINLIKNEEGIYSFESNQYRYCTFIFPNK
jgi:hypothetical protein